MNGDRSILGACLHALALIAFALCACEQATRPAAPLEVGETIDYEMVARYPVDNWNCVAVVVADGVSDAELTALANELRAQFPENIFQVFTDKSQIENFVEWRRNEGSDDLLKTEEWISERHLATIRRYKNADGRWGRQVRGGPAHASLAGQRISMLGA